MNKTEATYRALRERILQGTYAPGQRLVLSTLARELGVSSVPVREALRRLEAEGWVSFRPNIGAEVCPVDAGEWVAVMDVLALTEGRATALAARHLTAADLAAARTENASMRQALEQMDPLEASERNRAFHATLIGACPSTYLRDLVHQASERLDAMRRTVFVFVPRRTLAAVDEHEHLLGLIEQGAAEAVIERYAREHKLHTVTAYLSRDGRLPAPALGEGHELISAALSARNGGLTPAR
ncbi:MAG TPA: GntR family transcriptional regulator [Candidatus Binatia bacterium]|jgi:DNA-binding GntR family transcriptional regulator|nr:GntR family transcriptional regulator [Candidatus Binatia bacterium]